MVMIERKMKIKNTIFIIHRIKSMKKRNENNVNTHTHTHRKIMLIHSHCFNQFSRIYLIDNNNYRKLKINYSLVNTHTLVLFL